MYKIWGHYRLFLFQFLLSQRQKIHRKCSQKLPKEALAVGLEALMDTKDTSQCSEEPAKET